MKKRASSVCKQQQICQIQVPIRGASEICVMGSRVIHRLDLHCHRSDAIERPVQMSAPHDEGVWWLRVGFIGGMSAMSAKDPDPTMVMRV